MLDSIDNSSLVSKTSCFAATRKLTSTGGWSTEEAARRLSLFPNNALAIPNNAQCSWDIDRMSIMNLVFVLMISGGCPGHFLQ